MSEKVKIKIARNVVHLPAIALRGLVVFPNNAVSYTHLTLPTKLEV